MDMVEIFALQSCNKTLLIKSIQSFSTFSESLILQINFL